ncbi:baseplate wedge subunit [Morganella phage vB_Mm5]
MRNLFDKSRISSRNSSNIEFDNTRFPLSDIGNKRPIGSVNTDQLNDGVYYANVQSAISDVYSIAYKPTGYVYISTVDSPPIAKQQVSRLVFSGDNLDAITDPSGKGAFILFVLFGIPIRIESGVTVQYACEQIYNEFKKKELAGEVFDFVDLKTEDKTSWIECRFIDCLPHRFDTYSKYGMTITEEIDVKSVYGHGNWKRLGSESKFGIELFYFEKID